MNENQRLACVMLGEFLARHCFYNVDYNSAFRKSVRFLDKNEVDRLLNELIYLRCSEVQSDILHEIQNDEKLGLVLKNFYDSLCELLNLQDVDYIQSKINYYAQINVDEFIVNLLFKNAHIDLRKSNVSFSEGFFKLKISFPVDMVPFVESSREMIRLFLKDEVKFLNMVHSKQVEVTKNFGLIIVAVIIIVSLILYFLIR